MQTQMRGKPRPVTATVTKPRWMQVPDPDVLAKIRRKSLESHGSTESLTSLLDHDSYVSMSDEEKVTECSNDKKVDEINDNLESIDNKRDQTVVISDENENNINDKPRKRSKSPYKNNFSAWEQWIVHKEKEDRSKRQQERERLKQEKFEKEKKEQEKIIKLQKAEVVRQNWLEKKNKEEILVKKMEKAKINDTKQKKQIIDEEIRRKAAEKFSLWLNMKRKENKIKTKQIKEENKKIEEHEINRKKRAEECFQRWIKQAKHRPKSAPNSYGVISGKVIGYHDRSAYPQPSFVNPVPWQPIHTSSSNKPEKPEGRRTKPYNWNPDKYL